eukprot:13270065-Alexandrium_andersonii.AAC.2
MHAHPSARGPPSGEAPGIVGAHIHSDGLSLALPGDMVNGARVPEKVASEPDEGPTSSSSTPSPHTPGLTGPNWGNWCGQQGPYLGWPWLPREAPRQRRACPPSRALGTTPAFVPAQGASRPQINCSAQRGLTSYRNPSDAHRMVPLKGLASWRCPRPPPNRPSTLRQKCPSI